MDTPHRSARFLSLDTVPPPPPNLSPPSLCPSHGGSDEFFDLRLSFLEGGSSPHLDWEDLTSAMAEISVQSAPPAARQGPRVGGRRSSFDSQSSNGKSRGDRFWDSEVCTSSRSSSGTSQDSNFLEGNAPDDGSFALSARRKPARPAPSFIWRSMSTRQWGQSEKSTAETPVSDGCQHSDRVGVRFRVRVPRGLLWFQECREISAEVADSLTRSVKRCGSRRPRFSSLPKSTAKAPWVEERLSSGAKISASASYERARHEELKSAIAHCKQSASAASL